MKGYKAFDSNLKCRDMQYKVGKIYEIKGELKICQNGFHFCKNFFDVYNYYKKDITTRICEVEALGSTIEEGDKTVTSKIKIVKELSKEEILKLFMLNTNSGDYNSGNGNSGYRNSGYGNSGDYNSGDYNSGDYNSGNRNSGYGNSGYGNSGNNNSGNRNSGYGNSGYGNSGYGNSGNNNSGDYNSGDYNSGYGNSGYGNSGNGNSGNGNSGDYNSGNRNSGYFNTNVPVYFFNKPSNFIWTQEFENKIRSINVFPVVTYVPESEMTEQEKLDNPSSKITGGFLRKTNKMDWTRLTENDKKLILSLPNYDDDVFFQISGVRLLTPATIKVIVNGVEKEIDYNKAKELGLV